MSLRVFNSCSSQEWSCWLLEYGERLIWSLTFFWLQTRAPMHHMSLLGPEPSSSSSGCSAASLPAVEVHGCWSWSVLEISQDFKTESDKIHKCGSSYSTFYVYGTLRIHMPFLLLKERKKHRYTYDTKLTYHEKLLICIWALDPVTKFRGGNSLIYMKA